MAMENQFAIGFWFRTELGQWGKGWGIVFCLIMGWKSMLQ